MERSVALYRARLVFVLVVGDNPWMDRPTEQALDDVLASAEEAADAWVRGDMERYLQLVHHARGFTLLAPYGGPATRHEDRAGELQGWKSVFAGGEATHAHVTTHAWGDTLVLVMTEQQHGCVAGQPDQDLSVRVTQVYRRAGGEWLLVHRHADPLVATLSPDEMRELGTLSRR